MFTAAVVMLNFLILAATSEMVWFLYSFFKQSSLFEALMREFQLL